MRLFALIAAAFALALPQTASAWGFYAHTITADIAEANVKPETRRAIERLMRAEDQIGTPDCPLATIQDASVWPDCLRGEGWRWAYTFAWHYQTEPITEEYSDRKNCSGGSCVSAQVTRNQRVLADESLRHQDARAAGVGERMVIQGRPRIGPDRIVLHIIDVDPGHAMVVIPHGDIPTA